MTCKRCGCYFPKYFTECPACSTSENTVETNMLMKAIADRVINCVNDGIKCQCDNCPLYSANNKNKTDLCNEILKIFYNAP